MATAPVNFGWHVSGWRQLRGLVGREKCIVYHDRAFEYLYCILVNGDSVFRTTVLQDL